MHHYINNMNNFDLIPHDLIYTIIREFTRKSLITLMFVCSKFKYIVESAPSYLKKYVFGLYEYTKEYGPACIKSYTNYPRSTGKACVYYFSIVSHHFTTAKDIDCAIMRYLWDNDTDIVNGDIIVVNEKFSKDTENIDVLLMSISVSDSDFGTFALCPVLHIPSCDITPLSPKDLILTATGNNTKYIFDNRQIHRLEGSTGHELIPSSFHVIENNVPITYWMHKRCIVSNIVHFDHYLVRDQCIDNINDESTSFIYNGQTYTMVDEHQFDDRNLQEKLNDEHIRFSCDVCRPNTLHII